MIGMDVQRASLLTVENHWNADKAAHCSAKYAHTGGPTAS